MPRKLDTSFMNDLKSGNLSEVLELLKRDSTLDLQIRNNQVHIYYRGGKIWDIKKTQGRYKSRMDTKYTTYCGEHTKWDIQISRNGGTLDLKNRRFSLPDELRTKADVEIWVSAIPFLKQTMDEFFSKKPKLEREYQQHVVNENNQYKTSNGTDYFIIDIEYQKPHARFDLVALLWPSNTSTRRAPKGYEPTLALIEMKFADNALTGSSGIQKHVNDVDNFCANPKKLADFSNEMKTIFSQKRELGLLRSIQHNKNSIQNISNNKPDLILLLAAHDPESGKLAGILSQLSQPKNCNLKIAVSNFSGYGLYQESLYTLSQFKKKFKKQIFCK